MKSGPCQDLGYLLFTKTWEEGFQLANDRPDEIRKLVDRLRKLDQGVFSCFVKPLHPGDDGLLADMKCSGGLRNRPSSRRPEFQDLHALDG
jgi:hypothetical protein